MKRILVAHKAADGSLVDVETQFKGTATRPILMLGSGGAERERAILATLPGKAELSARGSLPVLLGGGLGHPLGELLDRTPDDLPVAVVDKEDDILALTRLRQRFASPRIRWICGPDASRALAELTSWQEDCGGGPLLPLVHPFYFRLDRPWYQEIRRHAEASSRFDFWRKAVQPRFREASPRLLLITSKYFLMGEVTAACERLGIAHHLLTIDDKEVGGTEFVARLLHDVLTFKPDCILTLNHLGIDREGVLIDLLERLQLPLASWFVDNPQLIIHLYKNLISSWTTLFTWDADNIPELRAQGYEHVCYLPLGTNPDRFRPGLEKLPSRLFPTRVSFVGNSMVFKVEQKLRKNHFPEALLEGYQETAAAFTASPERSIRRFVLNDTRRASAYEALPTDELRLEYEAMLTWEATRQYRAECAAAMLPFNPVIVGDAGWKDIFQTQAPWHLHPEVSYYDGLPRVYPFSDVNFNCTSQQMKGAVNQRVFDVPAAGAFVLTDWREQMDALLEPGKEVIAYHTPEEAAELAAYYLAHPAERKQIAQAGRRRVLAEHTWEKRLSSIVMTMQSIYGR